MPKCCGSLLLLTTIVLFVSRIAEAQPVFSLEFSTPLYGVPSAPESEKCDIILNTGNQRFWTAGETLTSSLPVTTNAYQAQLAGGIDIFLTRASINPAQLFYASYFGGAGNDIPTSVSSLSNSRIVLVGYTDSTAFPVMNPLQPIIANLAAPPSKGQYSSTDGFVTVLNSTHPNQLLFSTFYGGTNRDKWQDASVYANRYLITVGSTVSSSGLITVNPTLPDRGSKFDDDVLWAVWDTGADPAVYGSPYRLVQASYAWPGTLNGGTTFTRTTGTDRIFSVTVTEGNRVMMAGLTSSQVGLSLTSPGTGSVLPSGVMGDVWIGSYSINSATGEILSPPIFFEILMNGAGTVTGIARYRTGACITGTTAGQIPILPNTYRSSKNAKNDIFVVCVDGSGNVIFSTYYGGDNADQGNSVIVNGTTVIVSGGVRALSIADGASVSSASPGVGLRAVTAMFDIVTGALIGASYVRYSSSNTSVLSSSLDVSTQQLYFCGVDDGDQTSTFLPNAFPQYPNGGGFATVLNTLPLTTAPVTTTAADTAPASSSPTGTFDTTPPGFVTESALPTSSATSVSNTDTAFVTDPPTTTASQGLTSTVTVQGNFTVLNLPISITNTTSFGSIAATGCVSLEGNLTVTVSADDVKSGLLSSPLVLVTSASNCLQGNFSSVSIIPTSTVDKCISLSAEPMYTSSAFSLLVTSRDRCKKDKFPVWAGILIAAIVLLLALGIFALMYYLKMTGRLTSCFKEQLAH